MIAQGHAGNVVRLWVVARELPHVIEHERGHLFAVGLADPGKQRVETGFPVFFRPRAFRFGDAIRVQEQRVLGLELEGAAPESVARQHTQRHIVRGRQGADLTVPVDDAGRIVPAVAVFEDAPTAVEDAVEEGYEHAVLVVVGQQIVDVAQALVGHSALQRPAPEQRPAGHHEQRRGDALSRHVADGHSQLVLSQGKEIVEVAADFLGRDHQPVGLVAVRGRKLPRQHRHLHFPGDVELMAEGHQLIPVGQRLTHQRQMLEGLVDGDLEIGEVDGFGDEVECPAIHRGTDVVHVAVGGHDDRADVGFGFVELLEESQAVHDRHIDIRNDHRDVAVAVKFLDGLLTVVREIERQLLPAYAPAKLLQHEGLEVHLVVYHQDLYGFTVRRGRSLGTGFCRFFHVSLR